MSAPLDTVRCTRRTFLLSTLLGLTAGGFGGTGYSLAGAKSCLEPQWLPKIITERQSAARLGRAYLDTKPEYRHCPALLTDIEQALITKAPSFAVTMDAQQIARTLQRLLAEEYKKDEVVSVADWVLSETEARLYALVYLATTTGSFSEHDNR